MTRLLFTILVTIFPMHKAYTKNKNEIFEEMTVQGLTENYKRDSSVIVFKLNFLSHSVPFNKTRQILQFQKTVAVREACKYHKLLKISLISILTQCSYQNFLRWGPQDP